MLALVDSVKVTKNKMILAMYKTWKDDTVNLCQEVRGMIENYNKHMMKDDQNKENEQKCKIANCKCPCHSD